jgi:hypothetical protein
MKYATSFMILAALFLVGCTRWNFLFKDTKPPPDVPPVDMLVKYLDDNSQRIQTLKFWDVDMNAYQGMGLAGGIGMQGRLVAQKPRNMVLTARVAGNQVVDMGSNSDEFWFWLSKAEPPYQFFCSYRALQEGQVRSMPLPFQPEWIMDALGMGTYGPPERYKLESDARTLRLVERVRSPQGKMVRKVIVMNRRPVQPPTPQVTEYLLLDDATGHELCAAHITAVHPFDQVANAVVPRRVEFRGEIPKQPRFKLTMVLDGLTLNPQSGIPGDLFVRQRLNGVPSYNLATGQIEPTATGTVQRVQGFR